MAKHLGNTHKAYIKVSTSYTWLTGEQNNSVSRSVDSVEVSDKSTDWKQFISGAKGATIDLTVFADNSDSAQQAALKGLYNGATVDVFIGELSSATPPAPSDGEAGTGIVTAINDTNDYGAVSTRQITVLISGALTHYPTLSS